MPDMIPTPELRVAAAYLGIFIASLFVTSLAGLLLSKVVSAVGLGGIDRLLGAVFGAARGVLILLAAALLAGLTSAPRQPYWRDSASGPLLTQAAGILKPLLPQTLAERLRYD
jgi:membrane protein required for colicin V production